MEQHDEFREEIIDIGETVICDLCNADYTDSDEQGGLLLGSYAVCPKCAPGYTSDPQDVESYCPEGMSFREWVLHLRGGDNTIRIQSWN